jgi:hypothetical protein
MLAVSLPSSSSRSFKSCIQVNKKSNVNKNTNIISNLNSNINSNKNSNLYSQYSLSQGYFDPISSSPPNSFMEKLEKRIHNYSKGSSH